MIKVPTAITVGQPYYTTLDLKIKLVPFLIAPTFLVLLVTTSIQFQINKNAVNTVSRRSTEQALRSIAKIIESGVDPIEEIRAFNSGEDTIGYLIDLKKRNSPCRQSKFSQECIIHIRSLKEQLGNRVTLLANTKTYGQYSVDGKTYNFLITKSPTPKLYGLMAVEGNDFGPETDELVNLILYSKIVILIIAIASIALSTSFIARPLIQLVEQVADLQADDFTPLKISGVQPAEITTLNGAVNRAHDDLVHAIAETERRSKQVEDYQRSLRHDLKSATLGALNMVQALEMFSDDLDDDMREVVSNAIGSAQNAYNLVHTTSKLEQFENMEFAKVGPSEVRDALLPTFIDENVVWDIPDHPLINISIQHFNRALSKLVSNAVKYSPPQSLVKVSFFSSPDDFVFAVEDRGYGIPKDKIEAIFEMGLSSRLQPEIEGTGVGLHSAKQCIQKHGGSIKVKSEVGKGSIFLIVCKNR